MKSINSGAIIFAIICFALLGLLIRLQLRAAKTTWEGFSLTLAEWRAYHRLRRLLAKREEVLEKRAGLYGRMRAYELSRPRTPWSDWWRARRYEKDHGRVFNLIRRFEKLTARYNALSKRLPGRFITLHNVPQGERVLPYQVDGYSQTIQKRPLSRKD